MPRFAYVPDAASGLVVGPPVEVEGDPPISERFHPDLVSRLLEVPAHLSAEVGEGWRFLGGRWTAPEPPPPADAAEAAG